MEHVEITKRALRQFGLMVGGIFLFIGLWPLVWWQEARRTGWLYLVRSWRLPGL